MKRLFLVSSFKDVAGIFANCTEDLKGKTVTFIPTASRVEKVVFYVNAARKALEKLELIVDELDISTAEAAEISSKIKNNDFIYVTGGNTFYLLQELKRTGADKLLIDEVSAGKLYIGESAGAMIASADVEYAKEMDSIKKAPDLKRFSALGLTDFCTVPHHTNSPFRKSVQKILDTYSQTLHLLPISNNQAILVEGDKVEVKSN